MKKLAKAYEVVSMPLDKIVDNPNQPRTVFDEQKIKELSKNIESEGLLQPIAVKHSGKGKYEVQFGSRRLKAFRDLGRKEIPAIVLKEDEPMIVSLLENIQREDLCLPDEARAFRKLTDSKELTQTKLAEKIGKDKSYVNRMFKLAGLVEKYIANGITFTKLSKSTYFELLDAPELLGKAEGENWTENKARAMIKRYKNRSKLPASQELQKKEAVVKPIRSESSWLPKVVDDPAEWELAERTEDGFLIYPFQFRESSKVDLDLMLEKLSDLLAKVEDFMSWLRHLQGKTETLPVDHQVTFPFQRKVE